jgi:protein-S-isoprenylcysteine O-methyltransferase Ste14
MQARTAGLFWVAAQVALVALMLVISVPWHLNPASMAFAIAGVAMAFWVLLHNRLGNFNIQPAIKPTARLITSGPYRWLRHPMYVSLLLIMAAIAFQLPGGLMALLWLLLAGVLNAKASLEERLLEQRWPEYRDYRRRTPRWGLTPFRGN